ncbi:MFS transporter [Phenylobacterium sp.]|uniref:MFS transporter n=1 Tax=Phenylobacterium sp. TaxID=1871053 RepID=UPI00286D3F70|nr:MFS transporter [Phenylobacterium sp.]
MASLAASPPASFLTGHRTWLFAATSFPLQALIIAVAVYLPQHFAKGLGLELAAVGATFALVRLIDIPFDPLLGAAMDRTRSRFGRYRVWMLLGAPVLMAAIYKLFMAKAGIGTTYITIWLLIMYLGASMLTLAHSAWAATLAPTYDARSRIFGVMGAAGVAGMTLLLATPVIAPRLGVTSDAAGVQGMGWFILIAIPLAVLATIARTPEHVAPRTSRPQPGRHCLRDQIALLVHPSMGRVVLATFLFSLGTSWEGTLFIFYFTDVRGFTAAEASTLLMVALAAGFAGAPALGRLATRISKHGALMAASALYAACLASLWVIPHDAVALTCLPFITTGFLYAGFHVLLRAMTADVADEILLEQGQERGGALYALITLAPKVAAALAVWATFTVLAAVGYEPSAGAANTSHALEGVRAGYVLGPILFVAAGGLCMIGYRLTRERTAEIRTLLHN